MPLAFGLSWCFNRASTGLRSSGLNWAKVCFQLIPVAAGTQGGGHSVFVTSPSKGHPLCCILFARSRLLGPTLIQSGRVTGGCGSMPDVRGH